MVVVGVGLVGAAYLLWGAIGEKGEEEGRQGTLEIREVGCGRRVKGLFDLADFC